MHRTIPLLVAIVLVVAGCGSDGAGDDETTVTRAPTSAVSTTAPAPTATPPTPATTAPSATTTAPPTTTTTTTAATTTTTTGSVATTQAPLPGEPFDLMPPTGTALGVFGVAHDDVLNVRALPGANQAIVTTLDPLAEDVIFLGRARLLTQSIWYEVDANGVTGWASSRYLMHIGETIDDSQFVTGLLGFTPEAASMEELGLIVAEALVPVNEPELSTIVMSVAPSIGDLGEVYYDLAGLGDDSVWGYRLHVFGTPTDNGGFVLRSVESTVICLRGLDNGFCV